MNKTAGKWLYLAPRVLCILFALFISIFALDVFSEGHGFWETVLALLMHLIPTGLVLFVLAIAWRWEWIGTVIFTILGSFYVVHYWGRFHWSAYLGIAGPCFLIGLLFLLNWKYRHELKAG